MLLELERADADRRRREVALLDLFLGQDRRRAGKEIVAGIDALGDGHLEREVVDFLQAGNLLGLVFLDVDGALDQANVARARIALAAVHDAGERPDHVVRRHLTAVVEEDVVAQFEGVRHAVGRHRHRLRKFERELVVGGIPHIEWAVNRLVDDPVLRTRRGVRIEAAEARGVGPRHAEHATLARRLLGIGCSRAGNGNRGSGKPGKFTHAPSPLKRSAWNAFHSVAPVRARGMPNARPAELPAYRNGRSRRRLGPFGAQRPFADAGRRGALEFWATPAPRSRRAADRSRRCRCRSRDRPPRPACRPPSWSSPDRW